MQKKGAITLAVIAFLLFGTTGTVYASDSARPGDLLYPIDTAWENGLRLLTTDPVAEAELEFDILEERIEEMQELDDAILIMHAISESVDLP